MLLYNYTTINNLYRAHSCRMLINSVCQEHTESTTAVDCYFVATLGQCTAYFLRQTTIEKPLIAERGGASTVISAFIKGGMSQSTCPSELLIFRPRNQCLLMTTC